MPQPLVARHPLSEPDAEPADSLRDLRLGFFGSRSAFVDQQGTVWTEAGLARPLQYWATRCRRVTVALSLAPALQPLHDHALPSDQIDFLPLPWMPSLARGMRRARSVQRVVREVERRSDAVIVQIPFDSPLALLGARKPRVYHVIGDVWGVARHGSHYAGWKRPPALLVGGAVDSLFRHLLHRRAARAVVNGAELLEHVGSPQGQSVVSATMFESEVMSAARTRSADAPFRVLFVGNFRHEKGIDTLLSAFELLLKDVPDAELEIIGTPHTVGRAATDEIDAAIERLSAKGHVRFLGRRAFGPELFQAFADADVLAAPSRAEGTPRVLVEARAFGCPVVATPVGGVRSSVIDGHDGLLVPHDNPQALKDALLRIKLDGALRTKLIDNGLQRARRTTVDTLAKAVLQQVSCLIGRRN
jgi:glycosyltransferase involved in cell wall biosynthesis